MATEPATASVVLDDKDVEVVVKAAEEIQSFIAGADSEERLTLMLRRRLDREVDETTWSALYPGLVTLLGEDAATVIVWTATSETSPLDEIEKHVDPEVSSFLRYVAATFGAELRRAYERSSELPDNWRYVTREVYYDLIKSRPYIKFRVEKFNDDQVELAGPPDAMLALARQLLATLRLIGTPESFDEAGIEAFLEEADGLEEMLRSREQQNGAPAVAGPATVTQGTTVDAPAL